MFVEFLSIAMAEFPMPNKSDISKILDKSPPNTEILLLLMEILLDKYVPIA
ncbi:hypothetical protein MBORA_18020 [Methanobrevibacter oralis]|uniref:Uncharacterized protein n=1 Tax=Methanobrevibacter oralis TaxID=66851 RepID=A0A165ZDG5_METOA|nr:hypothetical protein MBORA_18020 [Methanobrevibacter oralis]